MINNTLFTQRTCGTGHKVQRRFCVTATGGKVGRAKDLEECKGGLEETMQVVPCSPKVKCPGEKDERMKFGKCSDMKPDEYSRKVKKGAGRSECRQPGTSKKMSAECKETCLFCQRKWNKMKAILINTANL